MGQLDNVQQEKKKSNRGSVNNESRLSALGKVKSGKADWGNVSGDWLRALIGLITSKGGAIRFGYSRDGGSYSIGLYLKEDTTTLWFNGDSDIAADVEALYHQIDAL